MASDDYEYGNNAFLFTISETSVRMDDNLCVPVLSFIELVISSLGIGEPNLMRNHKTRLGLTSNDHVSQITVVCLDIALSSAERKAL